MLIKKRSKLIKSGKNLDKVLMNQFKPTFDLKYKCDLCGKEVLESELGSYWVDCSGCVTEPVCKQCNNMVNALISERIQKNCPIGNKEITDKCYNTKCPKLEQCNKIMLSEETKKVVSKLWGTFNAKKHIAYKIEEVGE